MTRLLRALIDFLKAAFTDNVGLKALALAFAVGFFVYQQSQQDEQQRTIPVGVVMRLPPDKSDRELMTPIPANIHVTLRGTTRAIDGLIQTGVAPVEVDLTDGKAPRINFEPEMFTLPKDMEIKIIDPPSIQLEWQDVITRKVPVQASITGKPAEGFIVKGEPDVNPKYFTVRGPLRLVKVMQFVRLAAFDVTGLTKGTYTRQVASDAAPNRTSYIGDRNASVTVTVTRRVTQATFSNRPVEVVGVTGGRTTPRTVDVTVEGPPEVVKALRAEQIVPRVDLTLAADVDLDDQKHGSTTIKVVVELGKADAEIQPPKVTVRW